MQFSNDIPKDAFDFKIDSFNKLQFNACFQKIGSYNSEKLVEYCLSSELKALKQ